MKKGRVTIPTDESFVEGTKKIAELWGADAVRDATVLVCLRTQATTFYDVNGKTHELTLSDGEIVWL